MDNAKTIGSFSGTLKIGDFVVNRLGFGSMRLTGRGIWGPPADRNEALATVRRAAELGVNFIDTADSYGPDVAEELIGEALAGRDDILVATKAGLRRPGPDQWMPDGRPEYLIERAKGSLKKLGVEQIGLWQLHRIDPRVPMQEQFAAIRELLDEGVIANAGLSEVSIEEIAAASRYFKVATVQNRYNLVDRGSEDVLDYCERNGIGFIPWFPLAAGDLVRPGGLLDSLAKHHAATVGQIALAWMLKRSPVMLPIPGTSKISHLEQNVAAARLQLSDDEFQELERSVR
ncbi:aryl-alcohol dehydrogenase-like predicted oxidoreductase [Rhizobium azooxidifex]|uniref:Aryl-alcohol dehydrogenase-like predicted oxidoreductase n=1 Tax=Mycoplana azooxidifex TaxID=1636188 RepID=A0A7W6DFM0_9HYPH|nr:aldo/keto reductase [Mycoplana azooxidifex]MBB3979737.1 aryl-alcohol dehydrogenase-like predicted oxidoreductase [Mycoplana azooxidifex]